MIASSTTERAQALLGEGRPIEAIALLRAEAARGDVEAAFQLAVQFLTGEHVPRDLPSARRLLRPAAEAGHRDAALFEVALTANGSGGPADWTGAIKILRAASECDPVAAQDLAILDSMSLLNDGSPASLPEPEELAPGGAVVRYPRLLTPVECAYIARAAADLLEPAVVIDPASGRHIRHPHRTSDGAVLGPTRETLPVRAINRRVAAISGTDVNQGEALTVLRYAPGQQFRPHHDALSRTVNQRVTTVLLYLNQGFAGGETTFPAYGLSIAPRGGDALLFTNTLPGGQPDPRARHAGEPVRQGVKWLATRWIRARSFSLWTGPEAAPA